MAASKSTLFGQQGTRLTCDAPGCKRELWLPEAIVRKALDAAFAQGWKPARGFDKCPEHATSPARRKPTTILPGGGLVGSDAPDYWRA